MKYGLIGERLGHSFSKIIHEKLGDYEYELKEIEPEKLDVFMKERDFLGINVTVPYKERVIPYLDEIDDAAREIGAVNTILNRNGTLYGYNTDFHGLKMLFAHAEINPEGKKVAILGSGGTSKTAKAVLSCLGAGKILKVSRTAQNDAISYEELANLHSDVEIIVNTTPVGMYPNIDGSPLDVSSFKKLDGIIDVVYNPLRTSMVQSVRKAEGGLYMLVGQAIRASEIFTGNVYPKEVLDNLYEEIRLQKENIVLIGMPASGKSTVGRIIANRLDRRFVDTDDLIVEKIGTSIKDFFEKNGENAFRDIESQVISEIAGNNSLVISTGGGAILRSQNVTSLKYNGRLYFIDRPLDKLIPTESRPLSSSKEAIEKRYNERYSIYCGRCDLKIDADCNAEEVADKILELYK